MGGVAATREEDNFLTWPWDIPREPGISRRLAYVGHGTWNCNRMAERAPV